jgi:hypothetical protein
MRGKLVLELQLQQPVQALITMEDLEVMALKEAHQPPQDARPRQLVLWRHLHLAQVVAAAVAAVAHKAAVAAVAAVAV